MTADYQRKKKGKRTGHCGKPGSGVGGRIVRGALATKQRTNSKYRAQGGKVVCNLKCATTTTTTVRVRWVNPPPLWDAFLASRRLVGFLTLFSPCGRPREHAHPRAIPHRAAPRLLTGHRSAFFLGQLLRCTLISASRRVSQRSESRHGAVHRMHAIRLSLPQQVIAQIGRHLRAQHFEAGRAR